MATMDTLQTLYRQPDGTFVVIDSTTGTWRAATPEEAATWVAPQQTIDPTTGLWSGSPNGAGFSGGTPQATPASVSRDPVGGPNAPTFTPGIVFGQGVIPGQGPSGSPYQRQWFDVGGDANKETVNNAFYNNPSNFDVAWQKAINQFGGVPGSAYGDFLSNWTTTAQREFNNVAPYDPNVNVADFIDAYAPQLKGVFGLLSPANRGQRGAIQSFDRSAY